MSGHAVDSENEVDKALIVHLAGLEDNILIKKSPYCSLGKLNAAGRI